MHDTRHMTHDTRVFRQPLSSNIQLNVGSITWWNSTCWWLGYGVGDGKQRMCVDVCEQEASHGATQHMLVCECTL